MSAPGARQPRSRVRRLALERPTMVRPLIALFVLRIVVTGTEIAESRLTWWSALITVAIGVEAWRAWSVAHAGPAAPAPRPASPATVWDRILRPIERGGAPVLYATAVVYLAAFLALVAAGESRDVLLDVTVIARELITFSFLGLLLVARQSVRSAPAR